MGFNCTVTEIQNRGDGPIGFLWSFITLKMLVIKNDLITLCPITAEGKEEYILSVLKGRMDNSTYIASTE